MSNPMLLDRPENKVRWSEEALADIENANAGFESFDKILNELDPDASLAVRQDAETWYVVSDTDMISPVDPTPIFGLDTWDF